MTVANLIAGRQESVKRMLAYSSIAHAGYVLVGVTAMMREPARAPRASSSTCWPTRSRPRGRSARSFSAAAAAARP